MKRFKRYLLVLCGSLSLILGSIGLFIPVLPTTPFLLLAAFCYARGSERLHRWLLHNPVFGSYIRDYQEGRGVSLRHKAAALILLWGSIGYAAGFAVSQGWLRVLLLAIAVGVTIHLLKMKTRRRAE